MSNTIVIFGASGDLTSRKLIPALYQLHAKGRLPAQTRIVGVSRSAFEHDQWRTSLRETTAKFAGKSFDAATWDTFAPNIYYQPGDIQNSESFDQLAAFLNEIEEGQATGRVYYLSTMPQLYAPAIEQLGKAGLAKEDNGTRRIIIDRSRSSAFVHRRHR